MATKTMKFIDGIALFFLIVGGFAWGLMAFKFNLVQAILGLTGSLWIFGLVGLSTVWYVYRLIAK